MGVAFQALIGLLFLAAGAWAYLAKLKGRTGEGTNWFIITLILALTGLVFLAGAMMSLWVYATSSAMQSQAQGLLAK